MGNKFLADEIAPPFSKIILGGSTMWREPDETSPACFVMEFVINPNASMNDRFAFAAQLFGLVDAVLSKHGLIQGFLLSNLGFLQASLDGGIKRVFPNDRTYAPPKPSIGKRVSTF